MQQSGIDRLKSHSESTGAAFRTVVARTRAQVRKLQPDIEDLSARAGLADDFTATPAYFLSRIRGKQARPYVVAVYDSSQRLIGAVYGARRCIFGIPVGILECGDACGDGSILALERCSGEVIEKAAAAILKERFVSLARLSWNSGVPGVAERPIERQRTARFIARDFSLELWHDLWLERTYDLFLDKLGAQTRRNMRYYRRRAEQQGWVFVNDIERAKAFAAMKSLYPLRQSGRKNRAELASFEKTLSEVPGAFFSGLRNESGAWISMIAGWVKGSNMFIIMQLNDATYTKASLSNVLRSYVIERAIESGICRVKFIGGCEGSLKKYCRADRTSHLLLQKTGYVSQIAVRAVCRLFPESFIAVLLRKMSQAQPTSLGFLHESS